MIGVGVEAALARIPLTRDYRLEDFEIVALAGLTNSNYRIRVDSRDWVLRIPKPQTNRFIDRQAEAHNLERATELELAIAPDWLDESGCSLTPTLVGTRSLRPRDLKSDECLRRLLPSIRKLHQYPHRFHGRVDIGDTLRRYYQRLDESARPRFRHAIEEAERICRRLRHEDRPPVPSHNDLVLENILLADDRIWIIDWEYSAMASPYWDLATLCNAGELDRGETRRLLRIYCESGPRMKESCLSDYRELLQLLERCWTAVVE